MQRALAELNSESIDKSKLEEAGLALKSKIEEFGELQANVKVIKFATQDLTVRRIKLGDCHVQESLAYRK